MKNTLLKILITIVIISLTSSVIIIESKYEQRQIMTEDTKSEVSNFNEEYAAERATYSLERANFSHNMFVNKVDGYSIIIPNDMKVDMSFSNIRAVLENNNQRIEIYRQDIVNTTGSSIEGYYNYSNKFIDNTVDHKKEYEGRFRINDRDVYVLQWSRKPLKHVENDKCNYASIEITTGKNEVITFLFKSSFPINEKSEYLEIIRSFDVRDKIQQPYIKKIKQVENTSWDKQTSDTYEHFFGNDSSLTWGIFENKAPVDFSDLREIEEKVDFFFPILLYYTGFIEDEIKHPRVATALANAGKEGRLVELTLQTVPQDALKGNMIFDVLDGKYDDFLKYYVEDVVNSQYPVLFRVGNEMNGDWCVYSAHQTSKDTEIYKAFYKHIYQLFKEAGADNVIWVWNPNGESFPDFKWNDELCYYPGDEYVDVIGMTSYNTGTYYEGESWREFDDMYDPLYEEYIKLYQKPLMITEFASSSVGGDKVTWVENMFNHITKYERIKVALWWDGCDWDSQGNVARPYFIDETDELIQTFKQNLLKFKGN